MKILGTMLLSIIALGILACAHAGQGEEGTENSKVRVGIYDSRAIAVAFVGSEIFDKYMKDLRVKHDEAKAAGGQKQIAELEAEGEAQQKLLHKQAFSTAPVDNILEHIKGDLPKLAKKAGVGSIVSKWDKDALSEYKSAEQVDITMLLVEAFKPNKKQLKSAKAIQKHPPMSLEELEKAMSKEGH